MNDFSVALIVTYLSSLISVILLRYINEILGKSLSVLGAITAFTIAALRPEYFPDYEQYVAIFKQASTGDFRNPEYWASHSEPGFKVISYAIYSSGFDYIGLMIFISGLSFSLLVITSYIAKVRFTYLWFAYFSLYFITRELGVIRLSIASHLIVIAVIKKDFFQKLIIGFLASFAFQYFSIFAIAATYLSKIKPNIKILFILVCGSLVFGSLISYGDILFLVPSKQIENYGDSIHVQPGYDAILLPFARNILYSIILYWFMRDKLQISKFSSLIWMAFLSSISYLIFSGVLILAYRFAAYFGAIFPIAFAFLLNDKGFRNHNFLLIMFILVCSFIAGLYLNNFVWIS